MCKPTAEDEKKFDSEREIWENMTPMAWHLSVARKDSVLYETYKVTRKAIEDAVAHEGFDCIIEVGCGTGDIIGELDVNVQCYGIDINPDFLEHCNENHSHDHCEFMEGDATELMAWWKQFEGKYKKPLVISVNNTLNIMPEDIRGKCVSEMLAVAGKEGRCLLTYWNGNFFSHAIMSYYKKNEALCGRFNMSHVDWEDRTLLTPTGYTTHWMYPVEVQKLLRGYDVDINEMATEHRPGRDHIHTDALAIFIWFGDEATSRAKSYYDSEDAQKFYKSIWGDDTTHVGRYDLITQDEKAKLPKHSLIARAQELHEDDFVRIVRSKYGSDQKIRIADFGCGFGGLLRRMHKAGLVWHATGVDLSARMCDQARRLNDEAGCDNDIDILEESYLDVSVPDESVDLVISMDALLHVGPERQRRAIREASRVLRPGGWMIFTDIMQQESVDPDEMQPIYDRIHLYKMGTVSNYKSALESCGFTQFETDLHSANVSEHYGTVREVFLDRADDIGISNEYATKMESGLRTWRDLAPKNIVWGFMMAKKTEKVSL